MQWRRSAMAQMLRERRMLLDELHYSHNNRDQVLQRLHQVNELIAAEEERGPRVYLDYIIPATEERIGPKEGG